MEEFARSVGGVLIYLWDSEEKKELPESDHPSRKYPAIESEKNLREYLIAPNYPIVFSLSFVYSCSLESF